MTKPSSTFFGNVLKLATGSAFAQGLGILKREIVNFTNRKRKDIRLVCSASNGELQAYVHRNSKVLDRTFEDSNVNFHILIDEKNLSNVYKLGGEDVSVIHL